MAVVDRDVLYGLGPGNKPIALRPMTAAERAERDRLEARSRLKDLFEAAFRRASASRTSWPMRGRR